MGVGRKIADTPVGEVVLIPYSSGMGVGRLFFPRPAERGSLNTLFVRYGCGTRESHVLVVTEVS